MVEKRNTVGNQDFKSQEGAWGYSLEHTPQSYLTKGREWGYLYTAPFHHWLSGVPGVEISSPTPHFWPALWVSNCQLHC